MFANIHLDLIYVIVYVYKSGLRGIVLFNLRRRESRIYIYNMQT